MQLGSKLTVAQSKAAALVGAAVLLAGCGGSSAKRTTTSTTPRSTPTPTTTTTAVASAPPPDLRPFHAGCHAGAAFDCFHLTVPLDRAGRVASLAGRDPGRSARQTTGPSGATDAPKLTISVAIQHGRPTHGYLFFLAGGPGQPGLPLAASVARRLGPVLGGRRLVLVDQRGTGVGALRCPGLQRSVGSFDVALAARGTVEDCGRRLGARRAGFTTADTVADLEDVRAALRTERPAIVGVSYGTFVAERYALAHPTHVSALVLDSVVPQAGVDLLQRHNLARVAIALRLACAGARCRGDQAADLRAALRRVDAVSVLNVAEALSVGRETLPRLAAALHQAAHGQAGALQDLDDAVTTSGTAVPVSRFSAGLHAATLCAESRTPWPDATAVPADREQALAQAAATLTRAELGGFSPTIAVRNGLADACRRWPPLTIAPPAPAASARLPRVPTLLLAGALDLSTPVTDAQDELRRTPDGHLLVLPRSGHSVLLNDTTGCARRAAGDLLAGRPVPRRCA